MSKDSSYLRRASGGGHADAIRLSAWLDHGICRLRYDPASELARLAAHGRQPLFARTDCRTDFGKLVWLAADDTGQLADHWPQSGIAKCLLSRRPQHAWSVDGARHGQAYRRACERPNASHRSNPLFTRAILTG